jgi:predicted Zn-dependent protease with MMP-like domain
MTAVKISALVHDYANAPAEVLDQSRAHVTRIHDAIGVEIVWLELHDIRPIDIQLLRSMVTIHLLSRNMADQMKTAKSVMGAAAPGARVIKILYQRIDQMSNRRNEKTGSLLGHVIAHEIGHLFLPPHPHVLSGIMQEDLDLRLAASASLWFTSGQGRTIRRNVIARLPDRW